MSSLPSRAKGKGIGYFSLCSRWVPVAVWGSLLSLLVCAAQAQRVIAPAPPAFSGEAAKPLPEAGELEAPEYDLLRAPYSAGQSLLSWGAAHLHPHVLYRFLYGD